MILLNWSGPGWYTFEGAPPIGTIIYEPDVREAKKHGISVGDLARMAGRGTPRHYGSVTEIPSDIIVRDYTENKNE